MEGKKGKRNIKGFTLVELIIVITILAILATIAFVSFKGFMSDARDANRVSTITNIEKGLQVFQAKSGTLPEPDEKITYTGGTNIVIKQGVLSDNVAKTLNINTTPKDPLTKNNYYYSISNNGEYYQIGTDKENQTIAGMINTAYADTTTSLVRGNYNVDPSLPSLMVVPSSVNTASGIFDPSVCFIMNGGTNTFSSNSGSCEKKDEMSLKDFDSSLQGYWNFDEVGFTPDTNPYGGNNFYKDYSGNGHHAFNSGTIQGAGFIAPTQTGGYIGAGALYFTSGALYLGSLEKDIFGLPYKNITISMIANLFEYKNSYPYLINTFHSVWNISCHDYPNCNNQFSSEFLGFQLHSKTNTGAANGNQRGYIPGNLIITNIPYYYTFVYDGDYLKTYLDGKLYGKIKKSNNIGYAIDDLYLTRLDRVIRLGGGTDRTRDFYGIIDDVKIYNRALSDEEIRQQAKIAGF